MVHYGKILAILNAEQLILEIEDHFLEDMVEGKELVVFDFAIDPKLRELGIPGVYAPKGKIRIVLQQGGNLYLAERFREGGHVERRPIAALDFFTQEVRIGSSWSAEIDGDSALGIEFSKELRVNDTVGAI